MKLKNWNKIFSLFFVSLPIFPLEIEIFQLYKSSQWKDLIHFFNKTNPKTTEQYYIFAKALEKEKEEENHLKIIQYYLAMAGIQCNEPSTEFLSCIKKYKNVSGIISNFALLKAQSIAENNKNFTLQYEILQKGDFNQKDKITKTLYQKYLQFVYNQRKQLKQKEIQKAISLYKDHLQNPLTNLYLGFIYKLQNKMDLYYNHLFLSALNTKSKSTLKIIWNSLKENLDQIPKSYIRYLTVFYFDPEIENFLKDYTNEQILQTTNASLIYFDGQYFIEKKAWDSLYQLSYKGYTYLSQTPEILTLWIQQLYNQKQYSIIENIMKRFSHIKKSNSELWKYYLLSLKEIYSSNTKYKDLYFNEILLFLQNFPYNTQVFDLLLDFLIIKKPDRKEFQYEIKHYWEIAYSKIPNQTESGRFFYWLYRFYKEELNNLELANLILENFYYYAPGSSYMFFVWDEIQKTNKNINYVHDWAQVNSKVRYYQWITKYGYLKDALEFLSKKNLSYYYHPKAVELKNSLNQNIGIPYEILFLFQFGEYEFAYSLFDDYFKNKTTKDRYYYYLVIVGNKTKNLFVKVHALRQLLRELHIPEDPFTLPPEIIANLYPRPYRNVVLASSKRWNLEEDMIYAIMRQESKFRENAVSRSGAIGLMQILPSTGMWLAKKLKKENVDLFHPEVSIDLGSKFFSDLLNSNSNDFQWAAIAYNGGPGNLRKWKRSFYNNDFYYFLEILPSEESRNYARKTYQNYLHYKISRLLYNL